jgi:magnesium transporter
MGFKDYFIPKSMVYTGKHSEVSTTFKVYSILKDKVEYSNTYDLSTQEKRYIQVIGLSDVKKIEKLGTDLGIDALVLEDILNVRQRDKFEIYNNYIFGVAKVKYLKNSKILEGYMSMVMLENTLITFHETEPEYLIQIPNLLENHQEIKDNTIGYMFYQVLDIVTDHMMEVNELLENQMNDIEDQIVETQQSDQESFYLIRKQLLKLKNSVSPLYEQLLEITKDNPFINKKNRPYFDDLLDHLRRLDLQLTLSRELMRHLLDLNINNQSNKMNKIMTTLTLFSAIFIPLSFLTGFFGMNFIHFGILEYRQAVTMLIVFCLMVAAIMIFIFKKSKWL